MLDETLAFPVISKRSVGLLEATANEPSVYRLEETLAFPEISKRSVGLLEFTAIEPSVYTLEAILTCPMISTRSFGLVVFMPTNPDGWILIVSTLELKNLRVSSLVPATVSAVIYVS